jgi:uncharacterized protein YkwD
LLPLFFIIILLNILPYWAWGQADERLASRLLSKDTSLSSAQINELDIGKNISYLNEQEKDLLFLLNYVRRYGSRFVSLYSGDYWNVYRRTTPNQKDIKAINQLLNDLNGLKDNPSPVLAIDSNLCVAAKLHAQYLARSGKFSRYSEDGSTPETRLNKAGHSGYMAEIYALGNSPLEMLFLWLIDAEDTPKYRNRKNLLKPNFKYVGVGYFHNLKNGSFSVVNFDTDQF